MTVTGTVERTDHLDDSRCADLVLGLLPARERAAALAHAAACSVCEQRLRAHAGARARAEADAHARRQPTALPARSAMWRRAAPLTAAAAIVAALAIVFLRPTSYRLDAAPWLPVPGEQVHTREGAAEDPHLTRGLEAYRAHDLATADRELSAARAVGSSERMRRLYLAHVRYRRGDAGTALELLRGISWLEVPEPWRREGEALFALALRANGRTTSADSIERALRDVPPGTPFVP